MRERRDPVNKREELIEKYAADIKAKCNQEPDRALLEKVTIACGPTIYNADSSTVSSSDPEEVARVRANFLVKKLGLSEGPELEAGLEAVFELYGKSNRNKYRAVVYYLLTKHFGKEAVFA